MGTMTENVQKHWWINIILYFRHKENTFHRKLSRKRSMNNYFHCRIIIWVSYYNSQRICIVYKISFQNFILQSIKINLFRANVSFLYSLEMLEKHLTFWHFKGDRTGTLVWNSFRNCDAWCQCLWAVSSQVDNLTV